MARPRGPDERDGPVPDSAIQRLLASVDECAGRETGVAEWIDIAVASRAARRFKLDVSFDFGARRQARFSVNDKDEPEAFRERLLARLPSFGLARGVVREFFAIASPGRVQTTFGLKWGVEGTRDRVSLYFEELAGDPESEQIRRDVFRLADVRVPPVPTGARPVSVCIDYVDGVPLAVKSYDVFTDRPGDVNPHVPDSVRGAVEALSLHPVNGTRRYMVASRHAPGGVELGHKLLWMSEVHRPQLANWAWDRVDAWRAEWGHHGPAAVTAAFDRLRRDWSFGDAAFLYPDLVGLNVGASATPELVVYVSIR